MTAAARQRRLRERRKSGIAVYRLELPSEQILEALLLAGMAESDSLRRRSVEKQLATLLVEWSRRWVESAPAS